MTDMRQRRRIDAMAHGTEPVVCGACGNRIRVTDAHVEIEGRPGCTVTRMILGLDDRGGVYVISAGIVDDAGRYFVSAATVPQPWPVVLP